MKNINTKKVIAGAAALAVGASFLGAAVAAQVDFGSPVVKGDVIGTNGMPTATIIVGNESQGADSIWAGNIAAAIASKAYTTETVTTDPIVVPGTPGSTSTITGDGYLFDSYVVNAAETTKTIDNTDYSLMYKKDTSADSDHAGASTLTIYDELSVRAKIFFNTDKDVKDLVASIDKGDITYTVDFDEGIKNDYTDSGASPRLKFNLMGKNYTVDSYDGTTLKLVQNLATQTFTVGGTFTSEEYTVEVVEILDTGAQTNRYEVEMQLKNSTGTVIATDVFRSGDTKIFDEYLTANIDVDTVYSSSVKIIMGSSGKLELKNSSKITDFPEKGDKLWKSTFATDGNYLTGITLTTDDTSLRFTNDDALKIGDKIELPMDFGSVEFLGLTEEKSTEFTIKDNYINFTDDARKTHELFIYDLDEATTARDSYTSADIDGKPLYVKFYDSTGADANFTVQLDDSDGKYLVGGMTATPTWGTTQTHYTTKTSHINGTNANVGVTYDLRIPLYNNTERDLEYTLAIEPNAVGDFNSVKSVAMGLKETQAAPLQIGDTIYSWDITSVDVDGTDTGGFGDIANFIGGRALNAATFNASVARDEFQSIARIDVYNTTDKHIYSYIDAYTGDLVNLNDNDFKDSYKQVAYTDGTNTFDLSDEGNDTDLEFGYTTYGAYVSIEDGYPMFTLPEKPLKGQIFIGGGVETVVEAGQPGSTIPGTTYTVTTPANIDAMNLVKSDLASVAGTKIIVGGHLANKLAVGVTNDYLTQAGQWVMGKDTTTGNIVVAGFTADDTGAATRAFINAIQ